MDKLYHASARKIARTCPPGLTSSSPVVTTDYKLTKDLFENAYRRPAYNERASDDLPLGSRGGGAFKFYAPHDADLHGPDREPEFRHRRHSRKIDADNRYRGEGRAEGRACAHHRRVVPQGQ
jgi:hypothetical protein